MLAHTTGQRMPLDVYVECVLALPTERRDAVVVAALTRTTLPTDKVAAALAVLRAHDSEAIARAALGPNDKPLHPATAKRFAELAATRPGVARALAGRLANAPTVPALRAMARTHPIDEASLDAARKEQLAALRKSDPDNFADAEMVDDLAHRTIVDERGTPVFDAWTYATDTGVFFADGTTNVAAHLIQDHVELAPGRKADPGLVAGLAAALRGPAFAAKEPAAKKPAAKKPAAKKPAAKKPAAKKPTAKRRTGR